MGYRGCISENSILEDDGVARGEQEMEYYDMAMAEAERGREIIEESARDGSGLVLVLPNDNPEILASVLAQMDRCIADYGSAAVITDVPLPDLRDYTKYPVQVTTVGETDMRGVLRYASAANTDILSIKILSLRRPQSQKADILINFKDLTLDKIVRHGLYGIWEEE